QGFVMFTIKLKEGLADDVVVANKATIIFDHNAPIVTPEWVNEKDVVPPTSTMLRPTNTTGEIELKWQGTDNQDGSGVYCYDIYLKQDDGDYERIIARTTATSMPFTVVDGVTYSLYSIATDNAGNRESDKTQPDIRIPEDRLPFDDYAVTKWNNTFMLNLRKLSDDGYSVASCRWFKDGKLIGKGFTYSAGPTLDDQLETGAIYYFQITTDDGDERYSTNKIIGSQHSNKLYVYPNPVPQGSRLTVEGVEPGNLVEVYNYMGVCVSRTVATGNIIEMMLAAPAGVYVVRANGEAVKVVIK
ncbi:MAG: T9SS type A sorting domain-containing protein, partial [Bacteroidales bacterium]|nr:T9SS type A sorting domain-containing protein [Bacteroidales bacterium]